MAEFDFARFHFNRFIETALTAHVHSVGAAYQLMWNCARYCLDAGWTKEALAKDLEFHCTDHAIGDAEGEA